MSNSRTFRVLFPGSLAAATVGIIALTGWLLWPEWQRYSALRRLEEAGRARAPERFLDAVEAIGKLPADERLVSDLVERVKDRDAGVRAYSILTLAVLQPRPVSVVPLVIATLDDPDEDDSVRAAAAAGLWSFGREARGPEKGSGVNGIKLRLWPKIDCPFFPWFSGRISRHGTLTTCHSGRECFC